MPGMKPLLLAAGLAAAAAAVAIQPAALQAASSVCRTVNNRTVCSQSGEGLSCQTVNGKTHCLSGPGTLRCETIDGRTACTTTPASRGDGRGQAESGDDLSDVPVPVPADPGLSDPGWSGRDLSIERDGQGLRVRAGGLDVRLGRFP